MRKLELMVRRTPLVILIALLLSASGAQVALAQDASEALQAYVDRADESYEWKVRQRSKLGLSEVTELTLTSQTWREMQWKHRLFLIVPPNAKPTDHALLVVEGGSWHDKDAEPAPDGEPMYPKEAALLAVFAQELGSPVVVLLNVPQQPIFDGRKEDEIIALTFDKYLKTGDEDWPLLLPMTKSVVRAMDAVQEYASESLDMTIEGFTVAGASKRGWTTWLTSAVDRRVKALAPMVIDMLNLDLQFEHQLAAYGEFSGRIHDYTDLDLPRRMQGESGASLLRIVDPYSYREKIDQPKMLFLGTNDSFWTVDSLNLYWDDLVGEKYIVYVPNADHDLAMDFQRIFAGLTALHRHGRGGEDLPDLEWAYNVKEGSPTVLEVTPGDQCEIVNLWEAKSPTRDFREAKWTSRVVPQDEAGHFRVQVSDPTEGFTAVYAEAVYPGTPLSLRLCTTIHVSGAGDKE